METAQFFIKVHQAMFDHIPKFIASIVDADITVMMSQSQLQMIVMTFSPQLIIPFQQHMQH